ncbi:hypothetical protein LEP1GSC185_2420 [Leptospira licerasiae serovar Varillal str. VAR 010]|uniref:Transposase n=1 Tax=Leptospira licerasiae str. MMD4847 TaxID=1049971 RepID=A0ABN0H8K3_9LEPT|nr:hypothetical protein LEP1GSC185_2420 [Leptospira licerasiae serovar Varillal str. VAR 010]EJZ41969.1 hypothetical protein LEP1GSC178_0195 [Leptospira licerasiae str. MMD4847]
MPQKPELYAIVTIRIFPFGRTDLKNQSIIRTQIGQGLLSPNSHRTHWNLAL